MLYYISRNALSTESKELTYFFEFGGYDMDDSNNNKEVWKDKIEKAIKTFSFLQNHLEESIGSITKQIEETELKVTELSKAIEAVNHVNDVNESLFSPYQNSYKKKEELILKNELNDIIDKLPNLENRLKSLMDQKDEYQNIRECLDYLNEAVSKDSNTENPKMEKYYNLNCATIGLKILETQELERQRIARDLHDSTIQNLTNLVHKTELCLKLFDLDVIRARLEMATLVEHIRQIINSMREIIYNLRPMTIQDLGLIPAVERYIGNYKKENQIQVVLKTPEEKYNILPLVNLTLYRIIQEACNNIAKYAKATVCKISIEYVDDSIYLTIEDNGIGMNLETQFHSQDKQNSGFGLSIMKERAILLKGDFNIESDIGKGTKISVKIPLGEYKEELNGTD